MLFSGQNIKSNKIEGNIVEIEFNNPTEKVNKFNKKTLEEFRKVIDAIKIDKSIKGIIFTSGKDTFIAGADVTEFIEFSKLGKKGLKEFLYQTHKIFNEIEDMNIPSVTAINGACMGGGCELALATTFRMMSQDAKIGLPETKLGIYPGWGGCIRLSRIAGADNAIEWIAGGAAYKSDVALKTGVIHGVVDNSKLKKESITLLKRAIEGQISWKEIVKQKKAPLTLNDIEAGMVFEVAKSFVIAKAGLNYPAPLKAIETIQKTRKMSRDDAILIELDGFCELMETPVAESLIRIFLGDMYLKRFAKKLASKANELKSAAVLGAGIMGGGIAYQSASTGMPIIMKDIAQDALDRGLDEASNLLQKQIKRKKININEMNKTLRKITPTLDDKDIKNVDIVIEAVVENLKIKQNVLADLEKVVAPHTILTSNTSTISITKLAQNLKHPENFCGMHFFNPVHLMPLVEVIRGKHSSEKAIATTIAYALSMKKIPIVVNDCPGFLVNRVLFPYLAGFMKLLNEGVDFKKIDKIMEKFGWPMGPAYLCDVVGIDTAYHANVIMGEGFPDRMKYTDKNALQIMFENKRFGQKNGTGFYKYSINKKGKKVKESDPSAYDILKPISQKENRNISDEEIIERIMIPMIFESSRCIEEKIVEGPIEVDMGVIYGLGFPPFRGGVMLYADSIGVKKIVESSKKYNHLGNIYRACDLLEDMAKTDKKFYN